MPPVMVENNGAQVNVRLNKSVSLAPMGALGIGKGIANFSNLCGLYWQIAKPIEEQNHLLKS